MQSNQVVQPALDNSWKRALDVAGSAIALLSLSPLCALVAAAIAATSKGPIIYRATRVGRNGIQFKMLKFRTMIVDADRLGSTCAAANDWRMTRVGRFLRKSKLDELPQFVNVLRGDMSLIGPRPEVSEYVETYGEVERQVLCARPGLSDWASLWDFDEGGTLAKAENPDKLFREFILPEKLRLQLYYIENQSFLMDLRLILCTCRKLFNPSWIAPIPRLSRSSYEKVSSES
jgi:lipopolysaccharide/colanic/teichoic acid biosynthesis glycosyltransferase